MDYLFRMAKKIFLDIQFPAKLLHISFETFQGGVVACLSPPRPDRQDPTAKTRLPRPGCQDPAAKTRLPRSGRQDPAAKTRLPRPGCQDPAAKIRPPRSGRQDPSEKYIYNINHAKEYKNRQENKA